MLWSLLDGRAYTATELAVEADVSPQSASMHLKKLICSNLVSVEKQGRHRYFRLCNSDVAYGLEALANLVPEAGGNAGVTKSETRDGIKYARTCYDHLAGKLAVELTEALIQGDFLQDESSSYQLTQDGKKLFDAIGIDTGMLANCRRSFARKCLDWSERKHHLAGALGSQFLQKMLELDWIRRKRNSREVLVTFEGRKQFHHLLKIDI